MYRIRKVEDGFVVLLSTTQTPQQTIKNALLTRAKELRELAIELEKDAGNLTPRE
jgi:replication-associated recombination protein RarA